MFDLARPLLSFTTQCHHPVTERFTGYIFTLFRPEESRGREMFFSNWEEAAVFAARSEAELDLTGKRPELVTIQDYLLAEEMPCYVAPLEPGVVGMTRRIRRARKKQFRAEELAEADARLRELHRDSHEWDEDTSVGLVPHFLMGGE